jgi:hypothetical protein
VQSLAERRVGSLRSVLADSIFRGKFRASLERAVS